MSYTPPTQEERFAAFEKSATNHKPSAEAIDIIERLRTTAKGFAAVIIEGTYPSRESSLALTHLEETVMWAVKAVILDGVRNDEAARWLEAQVRGVADHYDTPERTYHPVEPPYRGPYSTETTGGGPRPAQQVDAAHPLWNMDSTQTRPSALITHGQQPDRW